MNLAARIDAFAGLGSLMPGLPDQTLSGRLLQSNNWFTLSEVSRALEAWSSLLTTDNLNRWTQSYPIHAIAPRKNILVITAGNIPLVGFHDFLSVLITGNRFIGRLSSRDNLLLAVLIQELVRLEPKFADFIDLNDSGSTLHAVIATGSDNSARYFQMQFGHLPHIIRRNRSSAAILDGSETDDELRKLAGDMLEYYGLGCRSVSHLYLPDGYPVERLAGLVTKFNELEPCEPYLDNLRFQKARLSMRNIPFIDTGQVILTESERRHSEIGIIHYSFYEEATALFDELSLQMDNIQCLIGHGSLNVNLIPFGSAQKPNLSDYADNLDTLSFLLNQIPVPATSNLQPATRNLQPET